MRELWLKFKRFYLPTPLAFIAKYVLKAILKTCRIEVIGLEHLEKIADQESCLMMLWHSRIAMTCEFFARFLPRVVYTAFLSNSRDGEPIARLLTSYPRARTIRVAHDMKHQALHKMIAQLKSEKTLIIVTPDGPKGPPLKVKPGIIAAAQATSCAIIPFGWEGSRCWRLNSWDQFRLPKPFCTITIKIGPPIYLSENQDKSAAAKQLELALHALESHSVV